MIPNYWNRNQYVITKKKLSQEEMEAEDLEYDGWVKAPNGEKEYYYIRRSRFMRPRFGRGRSGFGRMDGSQRGRQSGGRGLNRTDECRHPEIRKRRR